MDIRLRSVLKMNLRAAGNVALFKMFMYANMVLTVPHNVEELEQLYCMTFGSSYRKTTLIRLLISGGCGFRLA